MRKSVLYYFTTVMIISTNTFAWDEFRGYDQGLWDLQVNTQYFTATGNYSHGGGEVNSLYPGNSYNLLNFDIGLRNTPTKNWGYFLMTNVSNSSAYDGSQTKNNSSINNVKIGGDYLFYTGDQAEWLAEVSALAPFKKIDVYDNTSANNEGVYEVGGKVIGRVSIRRFVPFVSLGLNYRGDGRSTLMPFSFGSEYVFSSHAVGLGFDGFNSVLRYDDKTDNRFERESYNIAKNGSAFRFYAVNPNYLEGKLWYRYDAGGMLGFQLGYGTGITGADYVAGWNVFASLNFRLKDEVTNEPKIKRQILRPGNADIELFQEESNDGVDQTLFQGQQPEQKSHKPPKK